MFPRILVFICSFLESNHHYCTENGWICDGTLLLDQTRNTYWLKYPVMSEQGTFLGWSSPSDHQQEKLRPVAAKTGLTVDALNQDLFCFKHLFSVGSSGEDDLNCVVENMLFFSKIRQAKLVCSDFSFFLRHDFGHDISNCWSNFKTLRFNHAPPNGLPVGQETFQLPAGLHSWMTTEDGLGAELVKLEWQGFQQIEKWIEMDIWVIFIWTFWWWFMARKIPSWNQQSVLIVIKKWPKQLQQLQRFETPTFKSSEPRPVAPRGFRRLFQSHPRPVWISDHLGAVGGPRLTTSVSAMATITTQ